MRGFISTALSSLMKGRLKSIMVGPPKVHSRVKVIDLFKLGQGVMPASFKVHHHNPTQITNGSLADNSESVIERDADFWEPIKRQIQTLTYSSQSYRCPEFLRLTGIYSQIALRKFSAIPKLVSHSMFEFMPSRNGHIFGNRGPERMNFFRAFSSGGCADEFSKILQRMAMESIKQSGPDNRALISLDSWEKFLTTFPNGIGRLRRWCEINGLHKDLSSLFGANKVLFTTPPAGCFTFTFEYLGRLLDIYLYGRNLYVMGWRNKNGKFEMKAEKEDRKNFLSGEDVTVVPMKKNYRFIAPGGDVGKVRMGVLSLRRAFEALYKWSSGSHEGRLAIGTFAVHTSEAGRLQDVFKDICTAALQESLVLQDDLNDACTADLQKSISTVGAKNKFWIERYDHYAEKQLRQMNALLNGEIAPGIKLCPKSVAKGVKISQAIILNQIRIFPRDSVNIGHFKHEDVPSDPSDLDSVVRNDSCTESSKGKKWAKKSKLDKRKRKGPGVEEVPTGHGASPETVPLYLLEDFGLPQDQEVEQGEDKVVGSKR